MITDGVNNQHYLAIKSLSRLFRGITSNSNGKYYCLNCFYSYRTNNILKKYGRLCSKNDYCHLKMSKDNKILKNNHGQQSLKAPFMHIVDLECVLTKTNSCLNNLKESYTEIKAMHEPSGYSLVTCCSFDKSKNERHNNRGKDYLERFCKDLKNQAMKIINYEKK